MSTEKTSEENMEEIPEETEEEKPKKTDDEDKSKISASIQERLARQARKHAQEQAEKDAKLADAHQQLHMLKQQMQQQSPAQQQPMVPQQAQQQQQMPQQQMQMQQQVSPDDIIKHHTVQQKLIAAADTDPEFAKLIGNETAPQMGNFIPLDMVKHEMSHLDNMAAVVKHLKKNSKDYAVLYAMGHPMKSEQRVKFFNELSEKLEAQETAPRPPEFEPDPDLANNGSSGQDFNLKEYMKKRGY